MASWKTIVVLLAIAAGLGGFFYYDTYSLNPKREKAELLGVPVIDEAELLRRARPTS